MLNAHGRPYAGRRAVLVCRDGEERAIVPIVRERLGAHCELLFLEPDPGSLRARLAAAAETTAYDALFFACEGGYVADPDGRLGPVYRYRAGCFDRDAGLEIVGEALSNDVDAVGSLVSSDEDVERVLRAMRFPAHAATVRDGDRIERGIADWERVWMLVRAAWRDGRIPALESDTRPSRNPTRLALVAAATHDLVERLLARPARRAISV